MVFSWHATFPSGTFVPPHIHPTQDEFIYMLEGRFDLLLDGKELTATAGDLVRLPMQISHGIFNKSEQTAKCLFWVSPTRRLYDLFWAIHGMKEQDPAAVTELVPGLKSWCCRRHSVYRGAMHRRKALLSGFWIVVQVLAIFSRPNSLNAPFCYSVSRMSSFEYWRAPSRPKHLTYEITS